MENLVAINRKDLRKGDQFIFSQDGTTTHTVESVDGKWYSTPGIDYWSRVYSGPAVYLVEGE